MERYCTVLAATVITLCGLLITALFILYSRETDLLFTMKDTAKRDICLTPGCIYTAGEVLKHMDKHVDPCDNFYEFACGNFINQTIIPDDKTSVTLFSKLDDKVTEQLRVIIEEPSPDDEARPFRMMKDLYKTCMNKTAIEEIGLSYIMELLKRMGCWPVLEGDFWDESKFNWEDTVYKFKDEGFSIDYLIEFSVVTDDKNSTKRVIELDQIRLSLAREYLMKGMEEKLVQALYKYMVDIAVMFGADHDRAVKELKESLDFEIQLANISTPREERRDSNRMYNPMTIPQLQERFPSIPWAKYISSIMPKSVDIYPNEVVIVRELTYIEGLEKLLNTTRKRTQANYMFRRLVLGVVSMLTEDLRKRQLDFWAELNGQQERQPRWKECVGQPKGSLYLAVGSMYVQRYFEQEEKQNVMEMVNKIREEMSKTLQAVDWMDDMTKNQALEKAKSMVTHIAYPDAILDVNNLENFYHKLEITQGNYLEAALNLTKFHLDFSFSRLREPVNKTEWINHGYLAVVNAFYEPNENSIQLPAGILQGLFFLQDRPNYMNYGAIGSVIGHEMTHGFDDQGRQYDKEGNLVDWWDPATKDAYLKKTACIIHQYGNYTSEQAGMNLNGVNTQGENIADNGGIKQAYHAYNQWVAEHGQEMRLPGLQSFTPHQMFWISAANTWCSKIRSELLKLRIVSDVHSPSEFRVLGPISNRPEFALDFKCPFTSKMNPPKKCQVW